MEPIPETLEAIPRLVDQGDTDLPATLWMVGERVKEIAPDCVGLSLSLVQEGLTFTLVGTSDEVAVSDAIQYLDGGPCVAAAEGAGADRRESDVLSEDRWQVFAQGWAASGIASTLALPLKRGDTVVGSVNLYRATDDAFEGLRDPLADAVGAEAEAAVSNADLSFSTREEATKAPAKLDEIVAIEVAVGIIMSALGLTSEQARRRLRRAAMRAGVSEVQLARGLIALLGS